MVKHFQQHNKHLSIHIRIVDNNNVTSSIRIKCYLPLPHLLLNIIINTISPFKSCDNNKNIDIYIYLYITMYSIYVKQILYIYIYVSMYNVIYLHLVYIFGECSMYIPVWDIREQVYRYNSLKQLLHFRLLLSHTLFWAKRK